jgi:hypothetical protein
MQAWGELCKVLPGIQTRAERSIPVAMNMQIQRNALLARIVVIRRGYRSFRTRLLLFVDVCAGAAATTRDLVIWHLELQREVCRGVFPDLLPPNPPA